MQKPGSLLGLFAGERRPRVSPSVLTPCLASAGGIHLGRVGLVGVGPRGSRALCCGDHSPQTLT